MRKPYIIAPEGCRWQQQRPQAPNPRICQFVAFICRRQESQLLTPTP